MKLVLLMCIEEYTSDLREILLNNKIPIYSETEISGYRLDDSGKEPSWFSGSADRGIYSRLYFSFLDESRSNVLMDAVREYNKKVTDQHPIRAFLLHVEQSI